MNKIGFNIKNEKEIEATAPKYEPKEEAPIRSVATVRFQDGREYPYYNDKFNLKVGDNVFVDGKLYGKLGVVVGVTTKFKISRNIYKDVIAKLDFNISASFKKCNDYMIAKGNNIISKEQLLTWFVPPVMDENEYEYEYAESDEFILGDGYSSKIGEIECDNDTAFEAIKALENGKLKAVLVNNGVGIAVVQSHKTHIVDFELDGNEIKNIYCDCIDPNFCKHSAELCILLSSFVENKFIQTDDSFFAVNHEWFFKIIENKEISI